MVAKSKSKSRLRQAVARYRDARSALRTPASRQSRLGLDWMNFFHGRRANRLRPICGFLFGASRLVGPRCRFHADHGRPRRSCEPNPGRCAGRRVALETRLDCCGHRHDRQRRIDPCLRAHLFSCVIGFVAAGSQRRRHHARCRRGESWPCRPPRNVAADRPKFSFCGRRPRRDRRDHGRGRHVFRRVFDLFKNGRLILFTAALVLFQLADASMLPLIGESLAKTQATGSSIWMSGLIIAPQIVVAVMAPWVGYHSEKRGRKPLLLVGFAVEPLRAALLAFTSSYVFLVVAQLLSGITGARLLAY
jgi:hypothetical protein